MAEKNGDSAIHNGNGNGTQATKAIQEWKNTNVMFCHSKLDSMRIHKAPKRVLYHLRRRLGKNGHATQPGIDRIAKDCRMRATEIEHSIRWLETNKFIT